MRKSELDQSVWMDENGDMANVEKIVNGGYYARTDKYDFEAEDEEEMSRILKAYGFEFNGYEN